MYSQILPTSAASSVANSLSHLLSSVVQPRTRRAVRKQRRSSSSSSSSPRTDTRAWGRIAASWSGGRNNDAADDDDNHDDDLAKSSNNSESLGLKKQMWLSCDPSALPQKALMRHQFAKVSGAVESTQGGRNKKTKTKINDDGVPCCKRRGKRHRQAQKHRTEKKQKKQREQKKKAKKETGSKKKANVSSSPSSSSLKARHSALAAARRARLLLRGRRLPQRGRGTPSSFRAALRAHSKCLLRRIPFFEHDLIPAAQRYFARLIFCGSSSSSSSPPASSAEQKLSGMLRVCPKTVLLGASVAVDPSAVFPNTDPEQQPQSGPLRGVVVDHVRGATTETASVTVAILSARKIVMLLVLVPKFALLRKKKKSSFRVFAAEEDGDSAPVVAALVQEYDADKITFEIGSAESWCRIPSSLVF